MISAAHAGWQGARFGVALAAIRAMESLGAHRTNIRAAIGPTIGAASYEVGPEFPAHFLSETAANARFFHRPGRRCPRLFRSAGLSGGAIAQTGSARGRQSGPRHSYRRRPLFQLPPQRSARRARLWPPTQRDSSRRLIHRRSLEDGWNDSCNWCKRFALVRISSKRREARLTVRSAFLPCMKAGMGTTSSGPRVRSKRPCIFGTLYEGKQAQPTGLDFTRRDSLGVKMRDFPEMPDGGSSVDKGP